MKLLIGYDGSAGADDAVELARRLSAGEGEALLADVRSGPGPLPAAYYILGYDEVPWAEDFFSGPVAALAPLSARWRTYLGGPAAQILTEVAEKESFELIVVGSPHRGAIGRVLLGSVARGVVHGSRLPVAIAPRGCAGERRAAIERIAVACDGSPQSEAALALASALAARHGAALELLAVVGASEPAPTLAGFRLDPQRQPSAVLERGLATVAKGIEARGREVHAGSAAAGLAGACEDADLLVTGSQRLGVVGRALAGSVTAELIGSIPCPLLVVPAGGDEG